jgi:hypothetical protein
MGYYLYYEAIRNLNHIIMNTIASTTTQGRRTEISKGGLEISRVHATAYQKEGTLTAEIKQTVTTKSFYPSKSVSNNFQDNPFSTSDFGFSEKEYVSDSKRVVWVDVPEGSTVESVSAKLAALPEATVYRIYANKPIISDNQNYAISAGLTTMDAIADKQAIRYGEGDPQAGQLILKNGKPQYKADFFKSTATEDQDLRTEDPADFYASASMRVELAGVMNSVSVGQEVL